MAIQIVTGDLRQNKKAALIQKVLSIKEKDPQAVVYYIVPEHLKFEMEAYLLEVVAQTNQSSDASIIDIQVASFSRLAWFLLGPQHDRQMLSDLGLTMIIRQVLQDYRQQLHVYAAQVNYQSFSEQLLILFKELIEGNIAAADILAADIEYDAENVALSPAVLEAQRLAEIKLLYAAFLEELDRQTVGNYTILNDLIDHIQSNQHPHHYMVIDHHYYFSSQEMQLVLALAHSFKQIWLTLPLTNQELSANESQPLNQIAYQTYHRIRELAALVGIDFLPALELKDHSFSFQPEIAAVAQTYCRAQNNYQVIQQPLIEVKGEHHSFTEYDSPQSELRYVANQIHRLVVEEGYRYQDIYVFTRDMERFETIIDPIFEANNIPYFFDHALSMDQHPFFCLLHTLMNLSRYNWQLDDILSLIKSPLFIPREVELQLNQAGSQEEKEALLEEHRYQIYLFENLITAYGFSGYRFFADSFKWQYPSAHFLYVNHQGQETHQTQEDIFNKLRSWILDSIYQPIQIWKKAVNGDEAARLAYRIIDQTGVRQQLESMRDQAIEEGDIGQSRRHEQVWQVFRDALDEFYLIYCERPVELDEFIDILLAGLEAGSYHIIPPTLDQVTFTSILSPQVEPAKIAFVVGMDHTSLPQTSQQHSLLSKENRQEIAEDLLPQQFLSDYERDHLALEQLVSYQVLLLATEQLHFSYSIQVGDMQKQWSPYVSQVIHLAGFEVRQKTMSTQAETHGQPLSLQDFGTYQMALTPVFQKIRSYYENQSSIPTAFIELLASLNQYQKQMQFSSESLVFGRQLFNLIEQLFQFNQLPEDLNPETALKLFGTNLNLSVSRVEKFYQDPYSHFLLYGLRLQEKENYTINPMTVGDYFHEALDQLVRLLQKDNLTLSQLSQAELEVYLELTLNNMQADSTYSIFQSHPQLQAIHQQMKRRLRQFIYFTQVQQSITKSSALLTEGIFGTEARRQLEGFVYPLDSGGQLTIRGKIDRIDELTIQGQPYLQIVDYKSGNKNFSLVDAYYGLDLQILTYLAVALKNYPQHKALGAFYQRLLQKYQKGKGQIWTQEEDQLIQDKLSENKFNGFITIDSKTLELIEPLAESEKTTLVYPVRLKKDGYYKSSPAYEEEELDLLLEYTHWMFKQAAERIQGGEIAMAPFEDDPFTTSLNRPYRVITGFDGTQSYNYYRQKDVSSGEVLDRMRQTIEGQAGKTSKQDPEGGQ